MVGCSNRHWCSTDPQTSESLFSWADLLVQKHALRYQVFQPKPCTACHIWHNHFHNHNKDKRKYIKHSLFQSTYTTAQWKANWSFLSSCESFLALTNKQSFSHGISVGLSPNWTTSQSLMSLKTKDHSGMLKLTKRESHFHLWSIL